MVQHKDPVTNLSSHILTTAEDEVLSLGLNFATPPKKIPFSEVIQQVEPKLRFLSKPAANNIRLLVANALSEASPPKPNLSKEHHRAIKDLKNNNSIHILKADKGNATVVMDRTQYDNKIQDLISDESTYSPLSKDPTSADERRINQKLLSLHRSDSIPKPLYNQLRSSAARCPTLFGQPKIHKPAVPLRPIIATRGSPCYNTARHLADLLQPLVGTTEHHVKNSQHFVNIISNTKLLPTDLLVSFDVVSLFTSVPVSQACDLIRDRLSSDPTLASRTDLSPDQIHDLLLTCLNSTSFRWRDKFFKQTKGAAMGSPLSPIIANLFMEHLEQQALTSSPKSPSLWLRYVDDTFVIWPHSPSHLQDFLQHINRQHHDIQFTMETENDGSLPFLDVLISKTASGYPSHTVYRKPTHTDRYLNYNSHHPPVVIRSVPDSLIRRAHRLCDESHLNQELQHIHRSLTQINNFPAHSIRQHKPKSANLPSPDTKPIATVILPYLGKPSHRIQRILQSANIQVRHRSSHKLHSALHTHKDQHPNNKRPGVYRIPCQCGKVYIGETGRDFDTRLKEHKSHHRLCNWEKSAIVKHAQESQHNIEWDNSALITPIQHWYPRRVREAIEILRHDTVPQDPGLVINHIWQPILHQESSTQAQLNPPVPPTPAQASSPSTHTDHHSLNSRTIRNSPPRLHHYNLRRRLQPSTTPRLARGSSFKPPAPTTPRPPRTPRTPRQPARPASRQPSRSSQRRHTRRS